jgi:4-hydroxybenzoate polyprenyltransferase
LRGKAALKHEIASRVELAAETLPYDHRVLEALRSTENRPRVLCTASDIKLAKPIAAYLGLFELVFASDGKRNLSGGHKAAVLVDTFGVRGFDYAGNGWVDLEVWRSARRALVVNAPSRLARDAAKCCEVEQYLALPGDRLRAWLVGLRLHQWLKNLLVLLPLLASHRFLEAAAVLHAAGAFFAFSLCASGAYLLNDLLDLSSDRNHPRKHLRPFASGQLPLLHGLIAVPLLIIPAFVLAFAVAQTFALVLAAYFVMTVAYSLQMKQVVMVDVVLLAMLYTVRIIAGAVAIGSGLSFWLLAFSMFLFFSLAVMKRYIELLSMQASGKDKAAGRGYEVGDLGLMQSLGGASGYISVMVLALYINSPESLALYSHPMRLWLLCPALLYWISRAWIVAHRGDMHDDPVIFAATDRVSQVVILLCGGITLSAI